MSIFTSSTPEELQLWSEDAGKVIQKIFVDKSPRFLLSPASFFHVIKQGESETADVNY